MRVSTAEAQAEWWPRDVSRLPLPTQGALLFSVSLAAGAQCQTVPWRVHTARQPSSTSSRPALTTHRQSCPMSRCHLPVHSVVASGASLLLPACRAMQ